MDVMFSSHKNMLSRSTNNPEYKITSSRQSSSKCLVLLSCICRKLSQSLNQIWGDDIWTRGQYFVNTAKKILMYESLEHCVGLHPGVDKVCPDTGVMAQSRQGALTCSRQMAPGDMSLSLGRTRETNPDHKSKIENKKAC